MQEAKPLTERQKETLDFITSFIREKGYSPSLKEIAKFLKKKISTAQYFVEELEEKGYLKRDAHKTRGITPISNPNTISLLGVISAGKPIEPIENPEEIPIPETIEINTKYPHYALKVEGDSMIDMGILNGDVVLIRHQMTAENGDVIVGVTEDGATLKVFKNKDNQIVLEPRNPKYKTIRPEELEIRGVFVGLIRGKQKNGQPN